MIIWLALGLMATAPTDTASQAEPIAIHSAVPAREVSMTKLSTCDDTVFEISYTSTRNDVRGRILVRHNDTLIEALDAQANLFDKLSYVDGVTAVCGFDKVPSMILISGVDRETCVTGDHYSIGFTHKDGFGKVWGPNREP